MNCWSIGTSELVIKAIKAVSEEEPLGLYPGDLHKRIISELGGCSDLLVVEDGWSPIIQKAIQVIIDSELGYVDAEGRLHVSDVARVLASP